jgi:hypothetical protein
LLGFSLVTLRPSEVVFVREKVDAAAREGHPASFFSASVLLPFVAWGA